MGKRSSVLTWVLAVAVVVLTVALTLETAYLIWLHRQLSVALLGAEGSLHDLDNLLSTDLSGAARENQRKGQQPGSPLQGTEPLSATDLDGIHRRAEEIVGRAFADPALKGLLDDLDIESPVPAPAPESPDTGKFAPIFAFQETPDRYIITVNLPGVKGADMHGAVENGTLKVSGMRQGVPFSESFAFPGPVIAGRESISQKDGVLTVTARKAPVRQGRPEAA